MVKGVALPKKVFDSLRESIYLSLKNKTNLVYGKKVSSCTLITPEHYQRFDNFVTVTKDALASNTFCPEKYMDTKGARLFSLLPVYSFQLRHVQFDDQTFLPLLRKAGLFKGTKIKQEQLQRIIFQNFDFQKIGIQNEESLNLSKRQFW
jgi:hypothetical protein